MTPSFSYTVMVEDDTKEDGHYVVYENTDRLEALHIAEHWSASGHDVAILIDRLP